MVAPSPPDLLDHLIDCDRLAHRDAVGRHGRKDETSHFTSLLCVARSLSRRAKYELHMNRLPPADAAARGSAALDRSKASIADGLPWT
jgi:hypothetical protein